MITVDPAIAVMVDMFSPIHLALCSAADAMDVELRAIARGSDLAARLMTVPGVGPIVALAYIATLDDAARAVKNLSLHEADWTGAGLSSLPVEAREPFLKKTDWEFCARLPGKYSIANQEGRGYPIFHPKPDFGADRSEGYRRAQLHRFFALRPMSAIEEILPTSIEAWRKPRHSFHCNFSIKNGNSD